MAMTDPQPVLMSWEGDGFKPASAFWQKRADEQFVVHEKYMVEVRLERSSASHRAYFAAINEAFTNLPEDQAERFATSEHLRKWALIQAGYRDERTIVASSKAEAQRLAAFIKPMDGYAVVLVSDAVVTVYTARSQSYRAMPKGEFQRSKDSVLQVLAGLLGVTPDDLHKAGEAA